MPKQEILNYLMELSKNISVKTTSFEDLESCYMDEDGIFHNVNPHNNGTFLMHTNTMIENVMHLIKEYGK